MRSPLPERGLGREGCFPAWLPAEPIPPCSEPQHTLLLRPSPEPALPGCLPGVLWLLRGHPAPPGHPSARLALSWALVCDRRGELGLTQKSQ